jgi:hypothetical protein
MSDDEKEAERVARQIMTQRIGALVLANIEQETTIRLLQQRLNKSGKAEGWERQPGDNAL